MITFPPCKINLGLSILEKRHDGFHTIETVLYPVPLFDVLEIIPAEDAPDFEVLGHRLPGKPDDNLVVKACRLMEKEFRTGPVQIRLLKNIPAGAGLGGGSSDAAHTILLLNELFNLELPHTTLENLAGLLGSDCPFFIKNAPALATGRGDQFKAAAPVLNAYDVLIVKPAIHINTAEAYSWVTPKRKDRSLEEIIRLPVSEWQSALVNDFEEVVFPRHPELAIIKKRIQEAGALYTSMSGTGSAIFGLFDPKTGLPDASAFPGAFVWKGPANTSIAK